MAKPDGRVRTGTAFQKFYERKRKKAQARAMTSPQGRAHEPGKNSYQIRERHLRHLQAVLERHEVEHIGGIEQEHVDLAFEECVASIRPRASAQVSPNTLRNIVTSYKNFIRFYVDNGGIARARYADLVENLPSIEYYQRKMLIIPGQDWPEIFRIAGKRHIMDRVLLELAFYLAMRVSEVRTVRWMDLDLKNDNVQFFRPKRNDFLKVPVHPDLKASLIELQMWLEEMGTPPQPEWPIVLARVNERENMGKYVRPDWPCQPGTPVDENVSRRALRHALREFGITPREMICQGMHIARRSRACHLFREGVDIRIIAKLLGHKDFRTTLEYIRDGLDEKEMREAMNLPLDPKAVELYTGTEQLGEMNTPAVPQSRQAVAESLLTLINSGVLSEDESKVVLMRAMNSF